MTEQSRSGRAVAAVVTGAVASATTASVVLAAPADAAPNTSIWRAWDRVASCESGGRWHVSTGNGYYGGLQFSSSTWRAYGGHKYARQASGAARLEQIAVARRVLAAQGPGAWPVCGPRAGLSRHTGHATSRSLPYHVYGVHQAAHGTHAAKHRAKHQAHSRWHHKSYTGKHHYRVHSGDTLAGIAHRHHVHGGYRTLARMNHLHHPDVLHVGQVLRLP